MSTGLAPDPSPTRVSPKAARSRSEVWPRRLKLGGIRLAFGVLVLAVWQFLSGRVFEFYLISSPTAIAKVLGTWIGSGYLVRNALVTLEEALIGFVIGAAAGVAAGLVCGLLRVLGDAAEPYMTALYSLPKVALAPLFVVWFGIGLSMKIVLAAISVFFLVYWNVFNGVRATDPELLDVIRVVGASRWQLMCKIVIPGSRSYFYSGLRMGLPYAFVGAVVGEIIASDKGLGYIVTYSASVFDTTSVLAAVIVLMILATAINSIVMWMQRRAARWERS